ncbi:MAG: tetratricopeptide repeat protein [Candidatus Omnitrophota bacterium]
MKKILIVLLVVLVALYAALTIFSSKDEYKAEKLLYRALETYKKIAANPDVAPPAMLAAVEKDLKKVVEKFRGSEAAKKGESILAEFYLERKDYEKSIATLNDIIEQYKDEAFTASRAIFLKGVAFQKKGEWANALREFVRLRDDYAETPLGFQVPLYIGNYYKEQQNMALADEAHRQAVAFYEKIAQESKGKVLGYAALNFLLQAHLELGNNEVAGTLLEELIKDYPSTITYAQQLPKIENLFINKLNNPQKAVELYRLIEKNANNVELSGLIDKKIQQIEGKGAEK